MSRFRRLLPYAALIVSLFLVLALAGKVSRLNSTIAELTRRMRSAQPGQYVPVVRATDSEGETRTLGQPPSNGIQLLYVYRSDCEYCNASAAQWRQVDQQIRRDPRIEIIAVSTDSSSSAADKFLRQHNLALPRISLADPRQLSLFRIFSVPQIIVIGSNGQIAYARAGVLDAGPAVDSVVSAAVIALRSQSPATTTTEEAP